MLHKDLTQSGLANDLNMAHMVDASDPRAEWLGKTVRYKKRDDWSRVGLIARDNEFEVREVQDNYRGDPILRIYCLGYEDTFGRACAMDELEMV